MLEFLQKTLDEAEIMTGSKIGFAHFLEADQVTLELQTWSTNTLQKMCTAEGQGHHYPIDKAGVWVDCFYKREAVVHNNYEQLTHRKGLPAGHAPILRELLVPVIRGGLIVAIFGVGNKPSDYTRDDLETFVQLANLTWDIVQRKRAEESLAQREQWYRAIFDHSPSGVLLEDSEGNLVDFNDAFCHSLGYSREELTGMNINKLVPPQRIREVEDHIQLLRHGKPLLHVVENIKKDGTSCWMELNETLIRLPDGRDGCLVISNDITERILAEQALREAKRKAEESNLLKSAFLANMSHEIRTPMGGIMGFMGLLQEEDVTPEERDYYISMMNEGAQRLLDTINDIIDMSKIEAGNMEISNGPIVLHDVMNYLFDFFKPQATSKSLSLRFNQNNPEITGILVSDRLKLEAILTNLIKNAIKFTSKGGIEFGYYQKNDTMVFYVRDSGTGIPADRLDAIFERFIQADMTITRGHEGSGLGLAISKAYCEALGGKIWVESTYGKGSTFSFSLPCSG
jgi:PAS domain S-box-containing protein